MRAIWVVVALAAVGLAGCAEEAPPAAISEADGTGAISGILVDDRFRPLRLTGEDRAVSEFDAEGFLLVQETGDRLLTNENGEFQATGLSAGSYTIRPNVEGHEGTAVQVQVTAGRYTEMSLVVRRVVSGLSDTVIIIDNTVVTSCFVQVAIAYGNYPGICYLDFSGEGGSSIWKIDLSEYATIGAVVFEVEFPQPGDWNLKIHPESTGGVTATHYAQTFGFDTDYMRQVLIPGETHQIDGLPFDPYDMISWLRPSQTGTQETYELTGQGAGFGATLMGKAHEVVSVFFDRPDDLDEYRVLR